MPSLPPEAFCSHGAWGQARSVAVPHQSCKSCICLCKSGKWPATWCGSCGVLWSANCSPATQEALQLTCAVLVACCFLAPWSRCSVCKCSAYCMQHCALGVREARATQIEGLQEGYRGIAVRSAGNLRVTEPMPRQGLSRCRICHASLAFVNISLARVQPPVVNPCGMRGPYILAVLIGASVISSHVQPCCLLFQVPWCGQRSLPVFSVLHASLCTRG